MRTFKDRVLVFGEAALPVIELPSDDVTAFLKRPDCRSCRVQSVSTQLCQTLEGEIPAIRQAEDQRKQPLCFQREGAISEMDIGHDRVISVLFNAENSHASSPLRADRLTSQRGQLGRGVRAFLEHTSLILPEWPMKPAGTALRTDAIASAVVVVIRCFLHQHLECQGASFWVHILLTSISEQKKAPSLFCFERCSCAVQ